jgi:hypothetical protein
MFPLSLIDFLYVEVYPTTSLRILITLTPKLLFSCFVNFHFFVIGLVYTLVKFASVEECLHSIINHIFKKYLLCIYLYKPGVILDSGDTPVKIYHRRGISF